MRTGLISGCVMVLAVGGAGCSDSNRRVEERQQQLDAAKAKLKSDAEAAKGAAAPQQEPRKDPYWDAEDAVVIRHEKACPEGLWSLFPGPAPGGSDATRKVNEAKRAGLANALRGKVFIARLRGSEEVKLGAYDAPKGQLPLELKGVIDCEDSIGRIAFAFGDARAINPPSSAISPGSLVQSIWDGPPRTFRIPMKSGSEAKAFRDRHQIGMDSAIVFRVGKTDVHQKRIKTPKETNGEVTIGGTVDDFGAGRLIRANVEAIRGARESRTDCGGGHEGSLEDRARVGCAHESRLTRGHRRRPARRLTCARGVRRPASGLGALRRGRRARNGRPLRRPGGRRPLAPGRLHRGRRRAQHGPRPQRERGLGGGASARLGWTGERLSITGGAWAQLAPLAQPSLQYAPTLRAAWRFDCFAVSAGVFDLHALAIARLSVETEDFGLGYVAPLGAEAHATLRLGRGFGVRVQGLAFRVGDAQVGFLMLSGVFEAGRARGDA